MGWRPEHTTGDAPEPKPEFDHSMTLGAAARTTETLIVWCRGPDCRHQNNADPRRHSLDLRCRSYGGGMAQAAGLFALRQPGCRGVVHGTTPRSPLMRGAATWIW